MPDPGKSIEIEVLRYFNLPGLLAWWPTFVLLRRGDDNREKVGTLLTLTDGMLGDALGLPGRSRRRARRTAAGSLAREAPHQS